MATHRAPAVAPAATPSRATRLADPSRFRMEGRAIHHLDRPAKMSTRTPFPAICTPTLFCTNIATTALPCFFCLHHARVQSLLLCQRAQDTHGQDRAAFHHRRQAQQLPPPAEAQQHAQHGWHHFAPQAAAIRQARRRTCARISTHSRTRSTLSLVPYNPAAHSNSLTPLSTEAAIRHRLRPKKRPLTGPLARPLARPLAGPLATPRRTYRAIDLRSLVR